MAQDYRFNRVAQAHELRSLKGEWLKSLTGPQDGMWESFRNGALDWQIVDDDEVIGYATVNEDHQLLQFYVTPGILSKGEVIFKAFIDQLKIKTGIVGTNNPVYLSIALSFVKELKVHTCLFTNNDEVNIPEKVGRIKISQVEDLERVVNFYHESMEGPKEWLRAYLASLIEKRESFSFEKGDQIIGAFEVRKRATAPTFADLGMVVSPDYRRQGFGAYLLNKAKLTALEWGRTPICSCEKENIGSLKSIHHCGFISMFQLLSVTFE